MHVVLYEPDIPGNTGNVGRSCLATGSTLHLVGKLGFSLDQPYLKRSGLDYWERVQLVQHTDWAEFLKTLPPDAELFFFSKKAKRRYWDAHFTENSYLIFGCETAGLPNAVLQRYEQRLYRIPMLEGSVRSLNLSTAVGVVLFEALRQTGGVPDDPIPAETA